LSEFTRGVYVEQHHRPDLRAPGRRAERRAFTYQAFVPATVAGIDLRLQADIAADIADAERALTELDVVSRQFHGLEPLSRSLMRSEAVASSWIEALAVSHRKLAEAEHGAPGAAYDEARRVVGNVHAMTRAIELGAQDRPLSVDDMLSMHGMLMSASTLPADRDRAGRVRDEPIFVGGQTVHTAEYVGPPSVEVPRLLTDLVEFINSRGDLSGVVLAAIAHAQFETIHPFHDGNGRVGRCLIHTILRRSGVCTTVFPPISLILAQNARAYVDGLNAFRRDRVDEWLTTFATSMQTAAATALGFGRAVADLEHEWLDRINDRRAQVGARRLRQDAAAHQLLQELPGMPVLRINDVADRLSVTWMAARSAVEELEAAGIVKNVQVGRRNRVYEAPELFDVVKRFEDRPLDFA
jgi:Fic family protein